MDWIIVIMDQKAFQANPSGRVVWVQSGSYWAFVPNPLPPSLTWTPELVGALSEADRALGELAGLAKSLLNPHLLIRPFIRREAVLSSRIEGTQASLADLYAFEAVHGPAAGAPSDVQEVANYVAALELGLQRLPTLPISLRLVREVHARLMQGVRGDYQTPGEFRRSQNWIGPPGVLLRDATYVPPPATELMDALDRLEHYIHSSEPLPPLVRLGLIHYQFEAIHPFLDGNGRVGRLLMTLLLCAWGLLPQPLLYLSAYFEQNRQTYYDLLLAVSQRSAWEAWLLFFLHGVASQARDAIQRAQQLQTLRETCREQLQTARAAARLLQVVDLLFVQPILTTRQVEAALTLDFATAQRYVDQLMAAGLLRETTGKARNRIYRADAVLAALDKPAAPAGVTAADVVSWPGAIDENGPSQVEATPGHSL